MIDFKPVKKRIGILFNPKLEKAVAFSDHLQRFLSEHGAVPWLCSAWEEDAAKSRINGTELLLSVGGDGTILRSVRVSTPYSIPVLGINFGKLGFMTEMSADEALIRLPDIMNGAGWIEERSILQSRLTSNGAVFFSLNDIYIGRRVSARLVTVEAKLNGEPLTCYRADGVIVSTASGSTGYSLAVSGPILHPESRDMILKPVAAHFTFDKAMVLGHDTVISLKLATTHDALLSCDGQVEIQLQNGEEVEVKLSQHRATFLRLQPRSYFYTSLESRLREKVI